MKHTIEVNVPDGYEFVRWGHQLMGDEHFIGHDGSRFVATKLRPEYPPGTPAVPVLPVVAPIVPPWQYPEWLGGAGVAMDDRGRWLVYSGVPSQSDRYFAIPDFGWCNSLSPDLFPLWSPPPCTDWRESWHPNPKWQR